MGFALVVLVVFKHFENIFMEVFQLQERFRVHALNKTFPKHQLCFKMYLGGGSTPFMS